MNKRKSLEVIKYILLLVLILTISLIGDNNIEILLIVNLISFIFYAFYIIVNIEDIKSKKINTKYKFFILITLIFVILLIEQKCNPIFKITILNLYVLFLDILKNIIINTKLKLIVLYLLEYLMLLKNNLNSQKRKVRPNGKNILILISRLNTGGAERVATNLANNLSKRYSNIMILTYNSSTDNDYKCKVPRLEINNKNLYRVRNIRKIKKKYNITHCISFCTTANYLNVASNNGEEKIISIRNYEKNKNMKRKIEAKIAAKYADKVVSVSEQINSQQISDYKVDKSKAIVINNFCEIDKIKKAIKNIDMSNEEKQFFEKYKVIISMGRLTYQKGQWYMIRAFKEVLKEIPDVRLVILGEGDEKERLQKLIEQLNMKEYIKLYGFKKNPYEYLVKAKLFIMTSLYEGMPNAILEAMCCGLPIISTDCLTGVKDILSPNINKAIQVNKVEKCKYGILVPTGDGNYYTDEKLTYQENELKKAIVEIITNRSLYEHYQEMAKTRIRDFQKDKIMNQWINLIEERK